MTGARGILIEKTVFGVEINRKVEVELELKTGETVIVMAVGEDDSLGLELAVEKLFGNKVGIIAGVNNKTFTSIFVPDEITVGLELPN